MASAEIQPTQQPHMPQPRQLSRAGATSFNDLKTLMADAFKELDEQNTHVPEGMYARTAAYQPEPAHSPVGGSPTSTRFSQREQLPRSASTSYNRTLGRQASERLQRELAEQAFPVLPLTSKMAARLERQCERGVEFLQRLQRPAYSRVKEFPGPVMPKTALRFSKGLAFMTTHKIGAVAGWTWGSGFVIARLGPGVWSAPAFLKDRFFSLGATMGVNSTSTCYAIPNEVGLEQFKGDELGASLDMALTLGMDPFEGDTPVRVATVAERKVATDRVQDQIKTYKTCDGVLLDASCRFGVHAIDRKTNKALYGDISSHDILEGLVQIPAEFKPLYDAIKRLNQEAAEVKPVLSHFELEKARVRSASMSRQSSLMRRMRLSSSNGTSFSAESGLVRRSMEDPGSAMPSISSSSSVPSQPEAASPNGSFRLFGDFTPLDIDLDDDEPLATITERVDAAA